MSRSEQPIAPTVTAIGLLNALTDALLTVNDVPEAVAATVGVLERLTERRALVGVVERDMSGHSRIIASAGRPPQPDGSSIPEADDRPASDLPECLAHVGNAPGLITATLPGPHLVFAASEQPFPAELDTLVRIAANHLAMGLEIASLRRSDERDQTDRRPRTPIRDTAVWERTNHDQLTGLLTRASFEHEVQITLGTLSVDHLIAVVDLELVDFEDVNDAIGFEQGNRLLTEVASRLRPALRGFDVIGRIGADEFAVMVVGPSKRSLRRFADRLAWLFEDPFEVDGQAYHLHVAVGMAIADAGQTDGADLLRAASVALHQARSQGDDEVVLYDESLQHRVEERFQLTTALRPAIATGQFDLVYQPLISLRTNRVESVEALVRWSHPDLGNIPPASFIPLAERSGTIVELGRWILGRACRQMVEWRHRFEGFGDMAMGVNLSVRQLERHGELDALLYLVEGAGLDYGSLVVELTESVMVNDRSWIGSQLQHLRGLGARIAIDDFGTGAAGLNHLRELPYDVVKIDRSYVERVGADPAGEQLVAQIIEMARGLGATLVAEGIETQDQLDRLTRMGCDTGQGYHLARPMAAEDLERWMVDHQRARPIETTAGTIAKDEPGQRRTNLN